MVVHGVRSALTVVLGRIQLARRRLRRRELDQADRQLIEAERHVHRVIQVVDPRPSSPNSPNSSTERQPPRPVP